MQLSNTFRISILFGATLFLTYTSNHRYFSVSDTRSATLIPVAMLRGDGPFLDRFSSFLQFDSEPGEELPRYAKWSRGHLVSLYPVGPAIVALPFYFPQVLLLDRHSPGWDQDQGRYFEYRVTQMAKVAASAIAALTGVAIYVMLTRFGLSRVALPAAIAAALGSDLWAVGSQDLWQHAPAALWFAIAVALIMPYPATKVRLFLAGGATAALVACRAIDIVFALAIVLYVARFETRGLTWFLPLPILIGGALTAYNLWFFGTVAGGQLHMRDAFVRAHGLKGFWSGNMIEGAAGTLLSPSHGLFVFCPWVAFILSALPCLASRIKAWPIVRFLMWTLVANLLILSCYPMWWGGHCFGPRYWIDAIPIFAIILGFTLEWARHRGRLIMLSITASIVFAVAVQSLGAFRYDLPWDDLPTDVDVDPERLWDWNDSVLLRCVWPPANLAVREQQASAERNLAAAKDRRTAERHQKAASGSK